MNLSVADREEVEEPMSGLDVLRSFAESRESDAALVPGITYRDARDALARIATLEAALRPFADLAEDYLSERGDDDPLAIGDGTEIDEALFAGVTLGELRRAREAK